MYSALWLTVSGITEDHKRSLNDAIEQLSGQLVGKCLSSYFTTGHAERNNTRQWG